MCGTRPLNGFSDSVRYDSIVATEIIHGDCLEHLPRLSGKVDLLFADPPYNIGFKYDQYDDSRSYTDFVNWTDRWVSASAQALAPSGSAFFMIGDEFAAEMRLSVRKAGLTVRNWIVWSYSFGQHRPEKFARSHVHIFYAVRNPKKFVFNEEALRVPSRRGIVYGDKRADPRGRVPDDTWTCYPRVCGTFRARQDWHGCQLPEDLLARIVTGASNQGDLVVDPFAGSGSTLVTAERFDRNSIGIEISSEYVDQARLRLADLAGELNDLVNGWRLHQVRELIRFYREAGFPLSSFSQRDGASKHFTDVYNRRMSTTFSQDEIVNQLEQLKQSGSLPVVNALDAERVSEDDGLERDVLTESGSRNYAARGSRLNAGR